MPDCGHRVAPAGVRLLGPRPQGPGPAVGRALPGAPARGRRLPRRPAPRPRGHHRRPAPRRGRGHPRPRSRRIEELFGPEVAHLVEGVTKIGAIPVLVERGAPGGELPQDAAGDGRRHPRHPGQAGRPAAQHADARSTCPRSAGSAPRRRPSTSTRPSPTASGMSRLKNELEDLAFQLPRARGLRGAQGPRRAAAQGDRGPARRAAARPWRRSSKEAQIPDRRDRRPQQAPLQHPPEAEAAEDRPRAGLRLPRAPDHHQDASRTATPPSGIIHHDVAARARAASRTSSPRRGPTATSRSTRR